MKKMRWKRILAALVALCIMVTMCSIPAFAEGANAAVNSDKKGVIMIRTGTTNLDGKRYSYVQAGTGFLINETTVVTCDHVVTLEKAYIESAMKDLNMTEKQVLDHQYIEVVVVRDVAISATVKTASANMDIAVLELKQQLLDREMLTLRHSSEVESTEECFALGFPQMISNLDNKTTYTTEDVTVTNGKVYKVSAVTAGDAPVDYVISSTKLEAGNSGGPLVDENGYVIGICKGVTGSNAFDDDYYYAIAVDQLISMLDPLGIAYQISSGSGSVAVPDTKDGNTDSEPQETPTPTPEQKDTSSLERAIETAEGIDVGQYTEESVKALQEAVKDAKKKMNSDTATQADLKAAEDAIAKAQAALVPVKKGLSMPIIIGIIAAAILLLVVIIILATRKKKPEPQPVPQPVGPMSTQPPVPPVPPVQPVQPVQPVRPMGPGPQAPVNYPGSVPTGVLNQGTTETTVLTSGAGETTVLSQNAITYGKLIRSKNSETIKITSDNFKVGRQRNAVDYCIADNTAVGRVHAIFVSKNGVTYLKDNNSTNGTFINNVRVKTNSETQISSGDKIVLGDEEFTYQAL